MATCQSCRTWRIGRRSACSVVGCRISSGRISSVELSVFSNAKTLTPHDAVSRWSMNCLVYFLNTHSGQANVALASGG